MKSLLRAGSAMFCLTTIVFAADYFPLAVGNVWTYSAPGFGLSGVMRMEIDREIPVGSDSFFRTRMKFSIPGFSDSTTGYMISSGNDVLSAESLTEEQPYEKAFEHQPVVGHVWDYREGGTSKIVFYGTFTVAAGTFSNCYATVDGEATTQIFAPDAGMVATFADGAVEFELASFNVSPAAVRLHPGLLAGRPSSPATTGVHPGLLSVVNILGRRVDQATAGTSMCILSPGTYVAIDKRAYPSGAPRAQSLCVTGR